MVTPASVILTYCLMGLTGVSIGYLYLCDLFRPSRSPVFYLTFFVVRFCYDALVYYWPAALGRDLLPLEVRTPLGYLWSIASFSCILLVFEGPMLEVLAVSFFTNMVSSVETAAGMALANMLLRGSVEGGYWVPFDAGVVLAMAFSAVECLLFRRPTAQLSRLVQGVSRRHGALLVACVIAAFVGYIAVAMQSIVYLPFSTVFLIIIGISLLMLAPLAVMLSLRSRELRMSEMLICEFNEMLMAYDAKVREKLALLERDHDLFAGVSAALAHLDADRVTSGQRERIARLEDAYKAMAEGTYCESPALDAVLVSYAERLRKLGVSVSVSVAGTHLGDLATAFVALALLDYALLSARQALVAEGERVTLRLRDAGEGSLFRLEIPSSWKPVGSVRQAERVMNHAVNVSEHIEDGHRVVLALRGGNAT